MNIGVNYLREHVPSDVRMHYAYIDNGQPANVAPIHTSRCPHPDRGHNAAGATAIGGGVLP